MAGAVVVGVEDELAAVVVIRAWPAAEAPVTDRCAAAGAVDDPPQPASPKPPAAEISSTLSRGLI